MFPARAGMNRPQNSLAVAATRVPRTGGDEPWIDNTPDAIFARSPHSRGWTARVCDRFEYHGVFLAHCGDGPSVDFVASRTAERFPAVRG